MFQGLVLNSWRSRLASSEIFWSASVSSNSINPLLEACIKEDLTIIGAPISKKDRNNKNPSVASSGYTTEVNATITANTKNSDLKG